jgi:hypothetical protein
MRVIRASAVALIAIAALVAAPSFGIAGEPGASAASYDGDDVAHQLDLRSAVISDAAGDRERITLRFWNRVPTWLIRGNGLWVEAGIYRFRIFRNSDGLLRIRGGDLASACCNAFPATHPNSRTFVGRHWVFGAEPPPDELRAGTFRKPDCNARCEWWEVGRAIDRTPWAPI